MNGAKKNIYSVFLDFLMKFKKYFCKITKKSEKQKIRGSIFAGKNYLTDSGIC